MRLWKFFDRIEDHVRAWFSKHPMLYSLYGGVGIVLFWRGVWHGTDALAEYFLVRPAGQTSIDLVTSAWDPFISFAVGSLILLSCGLFVSELIGKEIIISGLRGEKRLTERTETEVRTETGALAEVLEGLDDIHARLAEIEARQRASKKVTAPPPAPPKVPTRKKIA